DLFRDARHQRDIPSDDREDDDKLDAGSLAEIAVPALIELLKDPNLKLLAAYTLSELGPVAKSATPRLIAMLKDKEEYVAQQAANALGYLGPEICTLWIKVL